LEINPMIPTLQAAIINRITVAMASFLGLSL
jgi:hypothetical protein